jgi:hypothetical protein
MIPPKVCSLAPNRRVDLRDPEKIPEDNDLMTAGRSLPSVDGAGDSMLPFV